MPTKAKKEQQKELASIKAQARAAKVEAKVQRAKKAAKVAKKEETKARRAADIRGAKGILVSQDDVKDPVLRQELAAEAGQLVPPHRHEVHLKKETIVVTVTLHNVPPQKIVADDTTDSQLVVSTPAHNKKYSLTFPFPHGMKVDASKGDYTFESGELKCEFPVTKMPADVVRDWTQRLESVRKTQRARFDIDKEGDLVVRKRKTKMEFEALKSEAIAKKAAKKEKEHEAAKKADKKADKKAKKADDKASAGKKKAAAAAPIGKGGASAKPAPGADDDKAAMLKIARDAANHVSQSLKGRMMIAKAALERRQERAAATAAKKDTKATKMQSAFSRVLSSKKADLERRQQRLDAAAGKPAPKAAKKAAAGASPGKAVKFA